MATSFLKAVKSNYPESQLDVIMTKGLTDLKFFMPYIDHVYEFSKKEFSGAIGNYKFGRMIAKNDTYDLFFCLPFSFSSAISGFFTSSKTRVGYSTESRIFYLTDHLSLSQTCMWWKIILDCWSISLIKKYTSIHLNWK